MYHTNSVGTYIYAMVGNSCIGQHSGYAYPCTMPRGCSLLMPTNTSHPLCLLFSHIICNSTRPFTPQHTHARARAHTHTHTHTQDGELLSPKSRPSQAAEEEEEERDKEEGENLWNVWSSLLKNWEESSRRNHKMIHQLVREGIPQPLRAMAWQLLSGAHDTGLRDRYPSLITVSE